MPGQYQLEAVENRPRLRVYVYICLVGSVCLAIWLQFNHFEVQSIGEGSEQLAQVSKELTAQDRAEYIAQNARDAREQAWQEA